MTYRHFAVLVPLLGAIGLGFAGCSSKEDDKPNAHVSMPPDSGTANDAATTDAGGSDASVGDATSGDGGGGQCTMGQVCDYACAAGCTVGCLGGICSATCAGGGCTLDADFGASADYDCAGGNCSMDCDNGTGCALNCSGGGCQVACDVGSTCSVTCSQHGTPCQVTCENGGRGTCTGNCTMVGCDQACVPDPTYNPDVNPAHYSTTIDNPLMPWPKGAVWKYESTEGEVITVTVLHQTYTVALGIECVVVHDQARSKTTNEILEDTLDYYAQDRDGNVWYMGEKTAEYVNGQVASTYGTWEAGVDGALPGIAMYGTIPAVGTSYRQEYYACQAEDMGEIRELNQVETVVAGSYTHCIRTRDFSPLEPGTNEIKTYCPGVGNISEVDQKTGERVEQLVSVTIPVLDAGSTDSGAGDAAADAG